AVEVDVVDVLVALRRVLGVLERPVRAAVEPLRMLREPRMIRRALDREVEADLDLELPRAPHKALEVLKRAELRMNRRVAALLGADRPGAPRIVGTGLERVVPALPARVPDRMDRRQVDDVE